MTDRTRRIVLLASPVVVVVLVVGFLVFRPDTLFVDDVVDERLDEGVAAALAATATPSPGPQTPTTTPTPGPAAIPPAAPTTPEPMPTPTADPTPTPTPTPTGPTVLARGSWVGLEHATSGDVALLDDGGDLQVVLTDLDTSNGPDLHVILSPKAADPADWFGYQDGATYLGALKGNQGTQTYDVPDDLDLDDLASVVIWCERFSVGFGAADLA